MPSANKPVELCLSGDGNVSATLFATKDCLCSKKEWRVVCLVRQIKSKYPKTALLATIKPVYLNMTLILT